MKGNIEVAGYIIEVFDLDALFVGMVLGPLHGEDGCPPEAGESRRPTDFLFSLQNFDRLEEAAADVNRHLRYIACWHMSG